MGAPRGHEARGKDEPRDRRVALQPVIIPGFPRNPLRRPTPGRHPAPMASPKHLRPMSIERLRNIAIVAHVDHGKTTLVDCLLKQSGTLSERTVLAERVMDSNDQAKGPGTTRPGRNTAVTGQGNPIKIVGTPGRADFGGEVERVLSMVGSVLILVDAMDGPMPQTRFVTQKACAMGFKPIVVVNKVYRPCARPECVGEQVWDMFDRLGASPEQMDVPI